ESLVPRPHKVGERWLGEAETERGSAICDCPATRGEIGSFGVQTSPRLAIIASGEGILPRKAV
ncbi:hypothetical protein ABID19_003970, partial [Mesorhizobium robiniae]